MLLKSLFSETLLATDLAWLRCSAEPVMQTVAFIIKFLITFLGDWGKSHALQRRKCFFFSLGVGGGGGGGGSSLAERNLG